MELGCSRLRRGKKSASRPELRKLGIYKLGETGQGDSRLALRDNFFYSHKRISYTSQARESGEWKNVIFLRGSSCLVAYVIDIN